MPKISASLPRMKFDFSFHLAAWRNLSLPPCPLCTSFPYREHFFYFQKQNPKLKSVCNDLLSPQTMFFNPHYDFLSPTKKAKIFPIQLLFHSCPSPVLGPASDSALISVTVFLNTLLLFLLISYRSHKSSIRQSCAPAACLCH